MKWQSSHQLYHLIYKIDMVTKDLVSLEQQLVSELQSAIICINGMKSHLQQEETSWTNHQEELV